eukprot:g14881.t1
MASSFLESESRIRLRESMSVKMKLKMAHQIRSFVHELIELNLAKESVETPNKKEALQLVKKTTEEAKERQDHNFKPTPICSCMAKELLFRITKSLPYKSNCEGVTCFKYDKFVANPLYFYFKKQQWQLATTPELGMCTRKTTFSCGKNTDCNPDHSEGKPCKGKCKCDTDWINSCECAVDDEMNDIGECEASSSTCSEDKECKKKEGNECKGTCVCGDDGCQCIVEDEGKSEKRQHYLYGGKNARVYKKIAHIIRVILKEYKIVPPFGNPVGVGDDNDRNIKSDMHSCGANLKMSNYGICKAGQTTCMRQLIERQAQWGKLSSEAEKYQEDDESTLESILKWAQIALEFLGLIPGLPGMAASFLAAGLAAYRGKWIDCILNLLCMIPGVSMYIKANKAVVQNIVRIFKEPIKGMIKSFIQLIKEGVRNAIIKLKLLMKSFLNSFKKLKTAASRLKHIGKKAKPQDLYNAKGYQKLVDNAKADRFKAWKTYQKECKKEIREKTKAKVCPLNIADWYKQYGKGYNKRLQKEWKASNVIKKMYILSKNLCSKDKSILMSGFREIIFKIFEGLGVLYATIDPPKDDELPRQFFFNIAAKCGEALCAPSKGNRKEQFANCFTSFVKDPLSKKLPELKDAFLKDSGENAEDGTTKDFSETDTCRDEKSPKKDEEADVSNIRIIVPENGLFNPSDDDDKNGDCEPLPLMCNDIDGDGDEGNDQTSGPNSKSDDNDEKSESGSTDNEEESNGQTSGKSADNGEEDNDSQSGSESAGNGDENNDPKSGDISNPEGKNKVKNDSDMGDANCEPKCPEANTLSQCFKSKWKQQAKKIAKQFGLSDKRTYCDNTLLLRSWQKCQKITPTNVPDKECQKTDVLSLLEISNGNHLSVGNSLSIQDQLHACQCLFQRQRLGKQSIAQSMEPSMPDGFSISRKELEVASESARLKQDLKIVEPSMPDGLSDAALGVLRQQDPHIFDAARV